MAFVSYAQNFEDVMLWRALRSVQRGFYIDVGAQSPDLDSVTRAFSDAGWRGINVEPHPGYHADLLERRPRDINLRCALGDRPGIATIHLVGATGLSTLDQSIAGRHVDAGYAIERTQVDVETLDAVWDREVPPDQPVHFLKVDVEGFEVHVLRGNDWSRHRPWIVVVEATLPNSQAESFSEWESCLTGARYEFAYADGLNRYYVAQECSELKAAFRYPPNVFDNFVVAPLASAVLDLERSGLALATANDRIAQLESSLAVSGDELSRSRAELAQTMQHRDELARGLTEARATLDQSNLRAANAEAGLIAALQTCAALRGDLGKMYGSRSWRFTAPLRSVGRILRRLV